MMIFLTLDFMQILSPSGKLINALISSNFDSNIWEPRKRLALGGQSLFVFPFSGLDLYIQIHNETRSRKTDILDCLGSLPIDIADISNVDYSVLINKVLSLKLFILNSYHHHMG